MPYDPKLANAVNLMDYFFKVEGKGADRLECVGGYCVECFEGVLVGIYFMKK